MAFHGTSASSTVPRAAVCRRFSQAGDPGGVLGLEQQDREQALAFRPGLFLEGIGKEALDFLGLRVLGRRLLRFRLALDHHLPAAAAKRGRVAAFGRVLAGSLPALPLHGVEDRPHLFLRDLRCRLEKFLARVLVEVLAVAGRKQRLVLFQRFLRRFQEPLALGRRERGFLVQHDQQHPAEGLDAPPLPLALHRVQALAVRGGEQLVEPDFPNLLVAGSLVRPAAEVGVDHADDPLALARWHGVQVPRDDRAKSLQRLVDGTAHERVELRGTLGRQVEFGLQFVEPHLDGQLEVLPRGIHLRVEELFEFPVFFLLLVGLRLPGGQLLGGQDALESVGVYFPSPSSTARAASFILARASMLPAVNSGSCR